MFGGRLPHPGKEVPRPKPFVKDIDMPGMNAEYGHLGREGNTNYHVQLLHHNQREKEYENKVDEKEEIKRRYEQWNFRFIQHTNNKFRRGEIQRRLDKRLAEHQELLNKKREKLTKLLGDEEALYIWETVDQAQRGDEQRIHEMRLRSQQLQARNEAKRMAIVKEKKLQQYMERSLELRPFLENKNVMESKKGQLQQMRENEARRESERELEHFWYDVMKKEATAKMEREEQEELDRFKRSKEYMAILDKQIAGKKLLELEEKRIAEEDRIELLKVQEQLKKEKEDAEFGVQAKKVQLAEDLQKQLQIEREIIAQRKKEEEALDNAYLQLSLLEIEREKSKITDASATVRYEIMQYRNHLKDLEKERKAEEEKLNELLDEYRRDVEAKEDDKKCKEHLAKLALHRQVLEERARQMEAKKEEAREMLRKKQEENAALNQSIELNKRLEDEKKREAMVAREKYKDDLKKQIDYGEELRRREQQEMERQLEIGRKEEEYYQKVIQELCSYDQQVGGVHPFRRLIEKYDCHCPKNVIRPKY